MQKKYLFTLLLFGLVAGLTAQTVSRIGNIPSRLLEKAPYQRQAQPEAVAAPDNENPSPLYSSVVDYRDLEELIELTRWDAQSYGCMPSRIFADDNGNPVATWIYATDASGAYPERGTGYSKRENGAWSPSNGREESVRTGFPAVARLADGTEVMVAHATGFNPYRIFFARRAPGAGTWTESYLENPAGAGCLWARVATGGPDGQTVHVIAITTPVANAGVTYQGVDGHILYWRSTDGGLSWDKKAQIIPGLDNSKFASHSADSYTLEVNGEMVGVGVFADWNDVMVFKSLDNGENWESLTVNDFPDALENYAGALNDIYTFDDIGYFDPEAPDSLAVFSSDGFGALLLDDSGQAHVWFGRMYYIDNDPAAGTFYYPGINGLMYWKESFGENNLSFLTGALDYNGDTTLNITSNAEIGPYFNSLSSFPTVGTDAEGNIYLAYAAVHEGFRSDWGAEVDQFYRHLYLMKSTDNGDTWGEPYEITTAAYMDEFLVPFTEAVYPALPRRIVGNDVWVLYQQDATPGTNIWGANHATSENGMMWVNVPTDSIPLDLFHPHQANPSMALTIMPNPATDQILVQANLNGDGPVRVEIYNLMGLPVLTRSMGNISGVYGLPLQVGNLAPGVYFVRLWQGNRFATAKLVKE